MSYQYHKRLRFQQTIFEAAIDSARRLLAEFRAWIAMRRDGP